jgi:hypothetical protein
MGILIVLYRNIITIGVIRDIKPEESLEMVSKATNDIRRRPTRLGGYKNGQQQPSPTPPGRVHYCFCHVSS